MNSNTLSISEHYAIYSHRCCLRFRHQNYDARFCSLPIAYVVVFVGQSSLGGVVCLAFSWPWLTSCGAYSGGWSNLLGRVSHSIVVVAGVKRHDSYYTFEWRLDKLNLSSTGTIVLAKLYRLPNPRTDSITS